MALLASLLMGCGAEQNYGGEVALTPEESQRQIDDQIKKIEDDPNMPPQAKSAAIAGLKNRQQFAGEMGKGTK